MKAKFKKTFRTSMLVFADLMIINVTFLVAMFIHYEGRVPSGAITGYIQGIVIVSIGKLLIYKFFDLYNSVWEYASIEELMKVVAAVLTANIIGTIYLVSTGYEIFLGIYFVVLIVGSGATASLIATEMKNHPEIH